MPAFVSWTKSRKHPGDHLAHLLRSLLQQMLANVKVPPPHSAPQQHAWTHILSAVPCVQSCPSVSSDETSPESHLRVLGERERGRVEVLLRMLTGLLPDIRHACLRTIPLPLRDAQAPPGSPASPSSGKGGGEGEGEGEELFPSHLLLHYARSDTWGRKMSRLSHVPPPLFS